MFVLFVRVDNSDTALETAAEVTLSSTTSKDLCLHDQVISLCTSISMTPSGRQGYRFAY